MHKRIIATLFVFTLMSLTSCSLGGSRIEMLNSSNEEKKANARMEQIISAIEEKNEEALKSLFSKKALDETNDFDSEVDYLFNFLQGDIDSWKIFTWGSSESMSGGKRSEKLRSWYTLNTDKEEYIFLTIDFIADTINPDNAGLYTLRVIKSEDKDTQFPSWQEIEIPGIYKPEEQQ